MGRKAKLKDPNALTKTQERFLALVRKCGACYLDRSFDAPKFVALNGRELPELTVRALIAKGRRLVPQQDSLFAGDSQTWVAA